MEPEVELVGFEEPSREGKTLFVNGLPRHISREEKWAFLDTTFSKFGLLYSISLPQSPLHDDIISKTSDPTQPSIPMKTEYGFVTFYSSLAAKQALLKSKNTLKFGGCSIKVRWAKEKTDLLTARRLYLNKCRELCNYYLGFNSWNVHIVSMDNVEDESGWVGVRCRVEVRVRGCDGVSCGVGEWRKEGEIEEGISDRLHARVTANRMAFCRACEDAFSHILLVLIPGRPVSAQIICRPDEHLLDDLNDPLPINVLPS